jgi:osmoprotectant transport system ATP-binding protein
MTAPMIELEDVAKSFDGGTTHAVEGITLTIEAGGFVALVGGSGSGKTTTLKMINGLIRADRGRIRVGGEDVGAVAPHILRRRIGYVFQEVGLFPHLSVAENIGITPKLMGESKAAIEARVAELLDLVSLPRDFAARRPAALSGGQRQRVGVARALAARPKLMLMDEPFGALDPVTRDALGGEYRQLHERLGLTTLMVTHDITEAVLLADRIVVMDKGRVRAEGKPAELLASSDAEVRALMETPRRQADRVRERLEPAHG